MCSTPGSGVDKKLTLIETWPLSIMLYPCQSRAGMAATMPRLRHCQAHMPNFLHLRQGPHGEWMPTVTMGWGRESDIEWVLGHQGSGKWVTENMSRKGRQVARNRIAYEPRLQTTRVYTPLSHQTSLKNLKIKYEIIISFKAAIMGPYECGACATAQVAWL